MILSFLFYPLFPPARAVQFQSVEHPCETVRDLPSVPMLYLGKVQVGRDMRFCPTGFKIPVTVEQDPHEYVLLSVLVHIVPDRFAPQVVEQEGPLGIVFDDIVLVLFGIVPIHYFLGADDRKPQCP